MDSQGLYIGYVLYLKKWKEKQETQRNNTKDQWQIMLW